MSAGKQSFKTVILTSEGGVSTVTLNRPEVKNAMSPELLHELGMVLDNLATDPATRAVIITGAGDAFSGGGDVKSDVSVISSMAPFEFRGYLHTGLTKTIYTMEKPVIAAINGIAVGGAFDLALACDIRLASEKARLGEVFIKMGLIPDIGGIYFLPRLVGLGRASLLALTGDIIDAREAEKIGLVDKVYAADELMLAANNLAQRLASGPSKAIAMAKVAMHRSLSLDLDSSLDYTTNLQYLLSQTDDHKEALSAFLAKRPPSFRGD